MAAASLTRSVELQPIEVDARCFFSAVGDCCLVRGENVDMPFVSCSAHHDAEGLPLEYLKCSSVGDKLAVRKESILGTQLPTTGSVLHLQVGKIKDITQSGRTVKVQMAWFYRPEEAQGGRKVSASCCSPMLAFRSKYAATVCHAFRFPFVFRSSGTAQRQLEWCCEAERRRPPLHALLFTQAFHGERELFRSEHLDWALASTIQSKCRVHSLKAYQVGLWMR